METGVCAHGSQIMEDCALASKASTFCKKSDLDRVFIASDAASNKVVINESSGEASDVRPCTARPSHVPLATIYFAAT